MEALAMKRSNFAPPLVSFPSGFRWYVVRTNIRCEFRAQLGLASCGFRAFLPQITKWKRHARTSKIGTIPLFPRYMFVEADWNLQSLDTVHRTNGVESIVNNNGVPSSIYGDFVVELLERQLKGDFDQTAGEKIPNGAKVKIMDGKYEDELGYIVKHSGHQRVEVLLSIMGRRVRDTLALAQVRPAW